MLILNSHQVEFYVESLEYCSNIPSKLEFMYSVPITEIDYLDLSQTSRHLSGVLHKPIGFKREIPLFSKDQPQVLIFLDPISEIHSLYILVSPMDQLETILSDNQNYFLFIFSYSEFLDNDLNKCRKHIALTKHVKSRALKMMNKSVKKLDKEIKERIHIDQSLTFIRKSSKNLVNEIEESYLAIGMLENQNERNRRIIIERKAIVLLCESCKKTDKSTALIPCGHIYYCNECIIQEMHENKLTYRLKCPVCSVTVEEYKKVKCT